MARLSWLSASTSQELVYEDCIDTRFGGYTDITMIPILLVRKENRV